MKINGLINLFLVLSGALVMALGERWMEKEYALSVGIVLLMVGIYRASRGSGKLPENNGSE